MKHAIRYILVVLIAVVGFGLTFDNVEAKTLSQFRSELQQLKNKQAQNDKNKQMTQAEINKVKGEIDTINSQIESINTEIDELNADIERRNEEIKKMHEEIKQIIHYYQVSSSEAFYLEYVFKAKDYTDFIYRLALAEQLSEYRENTIAEYNRLIEENKKKIEEMAAKKIELDNLEKELSSKYKKLETELTGIEIAGVNIKDEIADLEKTVSLYQNTYKCSETEDLTACINRYYGNSGSISYDVPSSYGFYVPINYWTRIYPFKHHDNGLDLSTPEGQQVHPIADGVVVDIWNHYSCGGNMVYIAHTVNGQPYTSAYFHLKTVNVAVGQQVSHNSIIGISGGAAKGTSTNYYDGCTTGPHLHLQVATGHYQRIVRASWDGQFHISYSAWNSHSINPAPLIGL